jgi:hypothetical protein
MINKLERRKIIAKVQDYLETLSDEERVKLFSDIEKNFCRYCGKILENETNCNCQGPKCTNCNCQDSKCTNCNCTNNT